MINEHLCWNICSCVFMTLYCLLLFYYHHSYSHYAPCFLSLLLLHLKINQIKKKRAEACCLTALCVWCDCKNLLIRQTVSSVEAINSFHSPDATELKKEQCQSLIDSFNMRFNQQLMRINLGKFREGSWCWLTDALGMSCSDCVSADRLTSKSRYVSDLLWCISFKLLHYTALNLAQQQAGTDISLHKSIP